jgi:hypothetical protein
MVRPIVDEKKIQSLNSIPIEDLRPEFVQQSVSLRNKIINGMIPKKINGSLIDGATWMELAQQYVNAINDGTVPSIESSWTYICKQKAHLSLEKAKKSFKTEISNDLVPPVNERDIEQCIQFFSDKFKLELQKDTGELYETCLPEFTTFVKEQYEQLSSVNLNECRN